MAIKIFIKCWLVYWFLILIAPFYSLTESPWLGIFLQIVFFLSVLLGYYMLKGNSKNTVNQNVRPLRNDHILFLFWLSLIFSVMGSLSLAYDRIFMQGISFSDGLAVAREQWRVAGLNRQGSISSVFSVMGYLLAPAFYYSIINLTVYSRLHTRFYKFKWLLILIMVVINSGLTGGRTVAFVAFIIFLSCQIYKRQFFFSIYPKIKWSLKLLTLRKSVLLRNIIILSLLSYSLYIFKERSVANSETIEAYAEHAFRHLELKLYPEFQEWLSYVPFSSMIYLCLLFLGYLLHSYSVATQIFLYPNENDSLVIFTGFGSILGKLGIITPPKLDFYTAGKFSSLPGILFLQGNFALLCLFGFILGFLLKLTTLYVYKYPYNSAIMFMFVVLTSTLIVSPVLFIFDTLMFPFIIFQFCLFSMLLYMLRKVNLSFKIKRRIGTQELNWNKMK